VGPDPPGAGLKIATSGIEANHIQPRIGSWIRRLAGVARKKDTVIWRGRCGVGKVPGSARHLDPERESHYAPGNGEARPRLGGRGRGGGPSAAY